MSVTIDTLNRIGPQGPAGPEGPQGPEGEPGSAWYTGKGKPSNSLGRRGDFYLSSETGDYFQRLDDIWVKRGNIRGPKGDEGKRGASGVVTLGGSGKGPKGKIIVEYNETLITMETEGQVAEFVVPGPKRLDLMRVMGSGENISEIRVELVRADASVQILAKKRSEWVKMDYEFVFHGLTIIGGETVRVIANNFRPTDALFNASLVGDFYSAI